MVIQMEMEKELTMSEVCKRLHVSRWTVKKRIDQGLLKARREGNRYHVLEKDLEAYIQLTEYRPPQKKEE